MSETDIVVRRATPADLDTVVRFNAAMALETEGLRLDPTLLRAGVSRALADSSACLYFMAEVGSEVAGQTMVTFEWSDWRNGLFWWIQSVYVDPAFRRTGVFRTLHQHIKTAAAAESEVCGIRLYVHQENQPAKQTYRRLGMIETQYRLYEETWDQ